MPIPMPMPIPRYPGFCQFHMEKKEFAIEMKTLYGFPYVLMHIMPFNEISNDNKTNLAWFKVNNKNRTRYETFLKLKLKNKHTRTTLSNCVLLSLLLTFNGHLEISASASRHWHSNINIVFNTV